MPSVGDDLERAPIAKAIGRVKIEPGDGRPSKLLSIPPLQVTSASRVRIAVNAEQLAEIRAPLSEAVAGGEGCCVTFQVTGDEGAWIQFTNGNLNCAYRLREPPSVEALPKHLVSSLGGLTIVAWEAMGYVTYEVGTPVIDPLARLIDEIFTSQLGCETGDYHLDVKFEQL